MRLQVVLRKKRVEWTIWASSASELYCCLFLDVLIRVFIDQFHHQTGTWPQCRLVLDLLFPVRDLGSREGRDQDEIVCVFVADVLLSLQLYLCLGSVLSELDGLDKDVHMLHWLIASEPTDHSLAIPQLEA